MGGLVRSETEQYYFVDTDLFKNFSPIFGQLPILDWPPIPLFQNLPTDIFKTHFVKVGVDCLHPRISAA